MSFRSSASNITAENYVEIKQEASANLPRTTKLSANDPNFEPCKPKNTSFMPLNPTNIRPNGSLSSSDFDPSIISKTTTLKGSINPSTKPSYGSAKSSMLETFKSTTLTNVPSIISKTTTLKGSINPSTKPSTPTNGGYVDGTCTQEFMDIAHARVEERLCTSENTREVIEKEVFDELMYQADKSNQCVVGYGHGVNRSHVFDLEARFCKNKLVNSSDTSSEVMNIKSYLVSVEKKK